MNRIDQLFLNKKNNILSVFITAGYPNLNDTITILKELQKNKVDLIEIGIPFSDPLADGPTVQHSSEVALNNGMNVNLLFQQLKDIRKHINIPLLFMCYYNSIFQFGEEKFLNHCAKIGIDGLIIPDLPITEYKKRLNKLCIKNNLKNIFLITPQTPSVSIQQIDKLNNGFIYCVSSATTTGAKEGFNKEQINYFKNIATLKLKTPTLVGFGISNKQSFQTANKYFNGSIIGSAFIKELSSSKNLPHTIKYFVDKILA